MTKIFVTTLAKYNDIFTGEGGWLTLEDFESRDEFYEACDRLHKDEAEPEFMFQTLKDYASPHISEYRIGQSWWDEQEIILGSCYDSSVFEAGQYLDIPVEHIEETYQGSFYSDEDFAQETADSLGFVEIREWPANNIDWVKAASELMQDYCKHSGHYFLRNY